MVFENIGHQTTKDADHWETRNKHESYDCPGLLRRQNFQALSGEEEPRQEAVVTSSWKKQLRIQGGQGAKVLREEYGRGENRQGQSSGGLLKSLARYLTKDNRKETTRRTRAMVLNWG